MKCLSLELSSSRRSVAVWDSAGSHPPFESVGEPRPDRQGTAVFALVDDVLRQAGWKRGDITDLVIGLGPGSLTGVRAAISIAQGWQCATSLQIHTADSVTTIARSLFESGQRGAVTIAFDGQRGEIYAADCHLTDKVSPRLTPLRRVEASDLRVAAVAGGLICGPDLQLLFPEARAVFPTASTLARTVVLDARPPVPSGELAPVYLRETTFVKLATPGLKAGPPA